ncbi:MAG: hypothetical protein NZM11_08570 [Anaerolineales bacterium]|nr:hypothetical protein [Anaerolineales bacterium]
MSAFGAPRSILVVLAVIAIVLMIVSVTAIQLLEPTGREPIQVMINVTMAVGFSAFAITRKRLMHCIVVIGAYIGFVFTAIALNWLDTQSLNLAITFATLTVTLAIARAFNEHRHPDQGGLS